MSPYYYHDLFLIIFKIIITNRFWSSTGKSKFNGVQEATSAIRINRNKTERKRKKPSPN